MATALAARVEELRRDRSHGASWLARHAVEALTEVAETEQVESGEELLERLTIAGRELASSQPGVGAIAGAVGRVLAVTGAHRHRTPEELREIVVADVAALIEGRNRASRAIAIQLRPRLRDALVFTHSASATVREALLHEPPARVYCTVSHPHEEGRAFAEELRDAGLTVDLVRDEDSEQTLPEATLLLLGADAVYRDGTVCNKVRTLDLARGAQDLGLPTVIACELIKLVPVPVDEAPRLDDDAEVFDLTPPELIDEIVTEEGSVRPEDVAALVDRTPFLTVGYSLLRDPAIG